MVEDIFILPDGRKLGYSIYGPKGGWPVFYFHGTPSSRLELKLLSGYNLDIEQLLLNLGVQLIAVDRPGMGLSACHAERTFTSFAHDVHILSQFLNISRSSVMCWSGGGPYALAIARIYPLLIKDVFILCGFSRPFSGKLLREMGMNKWYFLSAKYMPWLLEFTLNRISRSTARYSLPQWISGLPDVDHQLMKDPENLELISRTTLKEACRQGAKGAVKDASLYFHDFGFDLNAIQQVVHFWWGTRDNAVIQAHAEAVEKQVANSVLHYKDGEGHLSVYVRYFTEAISLISRNP
jgi:pimeloyl-ACP methyl ester carboxylesterase